ncbi:MAG: hypothetical protein LBU17_05430 [Treponema sp.]|nr:hypothetical protein [Treponema sp.]
MEAVYRMKPNELTLSFLKMIQETFPDKEIVISIEEGTDETAYLSSTEANRRHLLEAIEADRRGDPPFKTMTIEAMEAMIQ